MYDDFFFPYEKAKLWTGNMFLLSLSNFLLYASLYMMLPVLPLWMVRHWYCSYAEAGAAIAVFGLAMFLPGTFNSYLIDTFKRKSVCFIAIFLFVASSLLYPYVATVGFVALVRAVQGGLFSVITMTTGSTLVIDVTASRRRTDANIAFAWAGRFGMVVGLALGDLYLSLLEFSPYHLYQYGSGSVGAGADSGGESSFPCSAQHFMVLAGPFFAAAHFVAGDEYDDGGHYLWDIGGTYLQ